MVTRMISSTSFAVVVTAGLLLTMAGLVSQQRGPTRSPVIATLTKWTEVAQEPPEVRTRDRIERPVDVDPPPPRQVIETNTAGIEVLGIRRSEHKLIFNGGGIDFGLPDSELLPIVTVAPTYPPSAIPRRLEGYVIVEFRVTASGSADNVRVTESTHRVFERAAIDAVSKFRFRPRVLNGEPVAVDGVKRRITFTLEG